MKEITKINKIEQKLKFELDSSEKYKLFSLIAKYLENLSEQKIDGTINKIDFSTWSTTLDVNILTLKEDRLKLIESKNED